MRDEDDDLLRAAEELGIDLSASVPADGDGAEVRPTRQGRGEATEAQWTTAERATTPPEQDQTSTQKH